MIALGMSVIGVVIVVHFGCYLDLRDIVVVVLVVVFVDLAVIVVRVDPVDVIVFVVSARVIVVVSCSRCFDLFCRYVCLQRFFASSFCTSSDFQIPDLVFQSSGLSSVLFGRGF